ncbi:hypothetical protein VTJ04DRAFT_9924 [Mycothermus thermophilus]|uniref:uncharacterized protein n=1 Tax=Humicola insolens TaxID=85995 RepID=UPI0037439E39
MSALSWLDKDVVVLLLCLYPPSSPPNDGTIHLVAQDLELGTRPKNNTPHAWGPAAELDPPKPDFFQLDKSAHFHPLTISLPLSLALRTLLLPPSTRP